MPGLNLRLTDAELIDLRKRADADGRSIGNYVRWQLFRSRPPRPIGDRIERRNRESKLLIGWHVPRPM